MDSVRGDPSRAGFPHSDITGSKLHCQLPRAFRRLARPSSPVIAKASTTCTSSLDPITLDPPEEGPAYRRTRLCGDAAADFDRTTDAITQPVQCLFRHCTTSSNLLKNTLLPALRPSRSKTERRPFTFIGLAYFSPPPARTPTAAACPWWSWSGSNRRPSACKADALPAELQPLPAPEPRPKRGGSGWVRTNDPRLIKTVL